MAGEDEAVRAGRGGGPKTEEGKARSSRNALKHGLRAVKHVFSDEDADQFQEYRIELMNELRPVGTVETALTDRIAQAIWRLRRIMSIEAEMFDYERRQADGSLCTLGEVFARPSFGGPRGVLKLIRYETSLQRTLNQSLRLLRLEQAARLEREEEAADEPRFPPARVPGQWHYAGEGDAGEAAARRGSGTVKADEPSQTTRGTPPPTAERGAGPPFPARDSGGGSAPGGIDPAKRGKISKRTPGSGHNGSRPGGIPPTQRA
jgi:hypothetical protein